MLRAPRLWGLAWFPALLGLGWALGAWTAADYFARGGLVAWLAGASLMALVILLQIILALASPLLDALSARAEPLWQPQAPPLPAESHTAAIARALREGLLLLGSKLLLMLACTPLLLFEAGRWLWWPLAGFLIAVDFLDYPLSRRRLPLRARRALLRRHAAAVIGYSLVCYGLLLTPGVGGLALLPCVLGGTWLMLRCLAAEAQAAPPEPTSLTTTESLNSDHAHTD